MTTAALLFLFMNASLESQAWADASTEGRFGRAFNAAASGGVTAEAPGIAAYEGPPLTVELWARVNSGSQFNILASYASKEDPAHWEVYTYSGQGDFSVYMPGASPAEIRSGVPITDSQWHYLAFTLQNDRVRLYVDGKLVKEQEVSLANRPASARPAPLLIGRLVGGTHPPLGCDGVVDEVRISNAAREVSGLPDGPFTADAQTVGLWHFDVTAGADTVADESASNNAVLMTRVPLRSLDEIDLLSYSPGPSPVEGPFTPVKLKKGTPEVQTGPNVLDLSGAWEMAEEGADADRLGKAWPDAIPAEVPGSVHTALLNAGKIPDPRVGLNDAMAREKSFKTWWFRKTFARPEGIGIARLVFDGVAIKAQVWLNGRLLGSHNGMFGGPVYDVTGLLRAHNTLEVKIDPAPHTETGIHGNNQAWRTTVVFNNCWGWHYSNIPQLGIWRPVRLERVPSVEVRDPFVAARDAHAGLMDLHVTLQGPQGGWAGKLLCSIAGDTFDGEAYHFENEVKSGSAVQRALYRFTIPESRVWWPNGMGEHPLYRLKVAFLNSDGAVLDSASTTFGIRTVRMAPLPGGPTPDRYNWTFVINGKPAFIKGNGWCTMDPLMDFSSDHYARFVELAESQHIQMFRAWGSGMPETDAFFDLCDRHGIMVLQEWPTAWNSHLEQPFDVMEETVRLNTIRLRNHPSLAMYGAGNESSNPFGAAIDMMGRLSVELDGTRPFHRGEPWGGSIHNYDCYWGRAPLDRNLSLTASFIGEFGLACMPSLESVLRYVPEAEQSIWPPAPDGAIAHHTPIFNTAQDMERLTQYSAYFAPQDNLEHFIQGSQLATATGVRHALELNRTRWPDCTGVLYYKMNDNYPAASWSCADWYGVPKIGHYVFQDSFNPLLACVLFQRLNAVGEAVTLPVYLLDDTDALKGKTWRVIVRVFNGQLQEIKRQEFDGKDDGAPVRKLGEMALSAEENRSTPLLVVAEIRVDDTVAHRTFYWTNYEAAPGCLFSMPQTSLSARAEGETLVVRNGGILPAVGVHFVCPEISDRFLADDGYFWLDPGEEHTVRVNATDGVRVAAWNAPEAGH
ncbi:MAG: beta-mannosidase [Candidatus Hydrogenedentes bacterium]|nr:beta-mannosidase [Candidatus Hydrogenedentota bacterium]